MEEKDDVEHWILDCMEFNDIRNEYSDKILLIYLTIYKDGYKNLIKAEIQKII